MSDHKKQQYVEIGWAYPGSTYAIKYGLEEHGCFVVEKTDGENPGEGVAGFVTLEEAKKCALETGLSASPWCMTTRSRRTS